MSGFPINLDLCEYFGDLRKYSSIFVNLSKCKNVRDVESHIKSVFGLEDNICLVYKKFLIPKSEDIQILQQYDLFKVQKCNFYDLQIHKAKKVNNSSTCDQKALNLTQSEKTIDLSCRPKQRLKANTCPSPGVSGPLALFDHKNCSTSQIRSSENDSFLNGNNSSPRDKPKHKKKKHFIGDDSDDDGDILDMSVKNCKGKKHKNCFSTDDGSNPSDGTYTIHCKDVSKELNKKHKKRKKNSEDADDTSLDLPTARWENSLNAKEENLRKKSKKVKECSTDYVSYDANRISVKNVLESSIINSDEKNPIDDRFSLRKKHKHSKSKNEDANSPQDVEENQYYSSSPNFTAKTNNHKKFSISKIFSDTSKQEKDSESQTINLEEKKNILNKKVDEMILELQGNSGSNTQNNIGSAQVSAFSSGQSTSDYNFEENHVESGVVENTSQEPVRQMEDAMQHPKKRKRKHKSKKKTGGLSYLSAVGPTISQLTAQAPIKSPSSRDVAKHVFFTEDDFVDDMAAPMTPPVKLQTKDLSLPADSNVGVAQSEQDSSNKPSTWQDQLLKLASSGTKPVVYHRNTSTSQMTSSKQLHCSTPTMDSNTSRGNTLDRPVLVNSIVDVPRCNGEVSSDNNNEDQNNCSGTAESSGPKKGLPDICKPLPIPNDLQNINLDDYPIIDQVRAEDLILFKVWKLNEHCEPGHSKPILAKVIETSCFPDRILLQIIEGCEECNHCTQSDSSVDSFTIELRWPDILEPRLFYP